MAKRDLNVVTLWVAVSSLFCCRLRLFVYVFKVERGKRLFVEASLADGRDQLRCRFFTGYGEVSLLVPTKVMVSNNSDVPPL